ncbi:MAG: hypothetical protein EBU90_07980 [Proteobacteria bacterium]|nr:hypothetical protein [Pseudomonadota bacterium]NBP15097.1 hypothetical protein [bacterium]
MLNINTDINLKDISKFDDTNDYLPILNGILLTDIAVIILLLVGFIQAKTLKQWYSDYNLSAVIADVLIIFIGIIITRFLYPLLFKKYSLTNFIVLAVIIQITHDILFYKFFSSVPRGINRMLDSFKNYAQETSYKAVLADSMMMVSACLLSSFLATQSNNTNIIILISGLYILPYLIYA